MPRPLIGTSLALLAKPQVAVPLSAVYAVVQSLAIETIPRSSHTWVPVIVAVFVLMVAVLTFAKAASLRQRKTAANDSPEQLAADIITLEATVSDLNRRLGPNDELTIAARQRLDSKRRQLTLVRQRHDQQQVAWQHAVRTDDTGGARKIIRTLGVIATALPYVLILGRSLSARDFTFPSSLSAAYYSNMRDVLVGSLVAMGVLLLQLRIGGREPLTATIAGSLAIVAALFPPQPVQTTSPSSEVIAYVHTIGLTMLMMLCATLCLFSFPERTDPRPTTTPATRNLVYRACGVVILASMVTTLLAGFALSTATLDTADPALWSEATWLVAFGAACLVRGDTIFKDRPLTRTLWVEPSHEIPAQVSDGPAS